MSRQTTIAQLVEDRALVVNDGYRTRQAELGRPGYRIIRVADVVDGAVRLNGSDFVSREFQRAIGAKEGQAGDILLTTKGTVGRVAVLPPMNEPVVYSPQLCFFRVVDTERLNPRYLRYWFKSTEFSHQAAYRMNNTDMAAYINLADIKSLTLTLPSMPEQRAMGEVLGALDDKIAANTKLATTADDLVRALFAGLRPEARDQIALSELISQRRELVNPTSISADTTYVGLEHIPRRMMWLDDSGTAEAIASSKSRFNKGDILFGKLRPYFHKVVSAPSAGICSTDVLVLYAIDKGLAGYVLAALSSDSVIERCSAASEGTRMPRTSWKHLAALEVPWPGKDAASVFSDEVSSLRMVTEARIRENQTLRLMRDTLLPQLMSGSLRVKDADMTVEDLV